MDDNVRRGKYSLSKWIGWKHIFRLDRSYLSDINENIQGEVVAFHQGNSKHLEINYMTNEYSHDLHNTFQCTVSLKM